MLPSMFETKGRLVDQLAAMPQDRLDIFETPVIREYIDFKWNKFARKRFITGFVCLLVYLGILTWYLQ